MKTPDEIKKGLDCCSNDEEGSACDKCPYNLGFGEYACIGMFAADALAYIRQLEAAQPKWISVEERLPKAMNPVLVCHERTKGQFKVEQGYKDVGD